MRDGLLQDVLGNHERAFRVIEVELGFLYDHFYTKYAVIFRKPLHKLYRFAFLVAASFLIQRFFLIDFEDSYAALFSHYNNNFYIKKRLDHYVLVTRIIMGGVISLETLQLILFFSSYWGKLLFLCKYVKKKPSGIGNKLYEQIVRASCSFPCLKLWGRKLGQYSFLTSFDRNPEWWIYNRFTKEYLENPGKGYRGTTFVKLSPEVQRAALAWIKTNGRSGLTKGTESLVKNGIRDAELFQACQFDTIAQVIMVWHVATSVCELQHKTPGEKFIVSATLSKYCAYLIVFASWLLPDHSYVTDCQFKKIVKETEKLLRGCKYMESKCSRIMSLAEIEVALGERTVIEAGGRVTKMLIKEVGEDVERMWKILSDFWTEMLLFVAISDDLLAHAEHLAQGGEFVTHLWALLFHAGIVKKSDSDSIEVV